jgi:hypothetical protein
MKRKNLRKDDIVVFYKERYDNLETEYNQYKQKNPERRFEPINQFNH